MKENRPCAGRCTACEQLSVRILAPPLVEIPIGEERTSDIIEGDVIWWTTSNTPRDTYEVVTILSNALDDELMAIALVPQAAADDRFCFRCFDGHVWPDLRPHVVNMPPEMRFSKSHPWADATWVSGGREPKRLRLAGFV